MSWVKGPEPGSLGEEAETRGPATGGHGLGVQETRGGQGALAEKMQKDTEYLLPFGAATQK